MTLLFLFLFFGNHHGRGRLDFGIAITLFLFPSTIFGFYFRTFRRFLQGASTPGFSFLNHPNNLEGGNKKNAENNVDHRIPYAPIPTDAHIEIGIAQRLHDDADHAIPEQIETR